MENKFYYIMITGYNIVVNILTSQESRADMICNAKFSSELYWKLNDDKNEFSIKYWLQSKSLDSDSDL